MKSSQESLTVIVIETLIKEAIEVVSSEKSEIQSRNRALEKKIGSLETELKWLNESTKKEKDSN